MNQRIASVLTMSVRAETPTRVESLHSLLLGGLSVGQVGTIDPAAFEAV
jgi:hypothetical protein